MNLRQSLKADFGIEVLVEGGSGLPDDPFVIEPCSAMEATGRSSICFAGLNAAEASCGVCWRRSQSLLRFNVFASTSLSDCWVPRGRSAARDPSPAGQVPGA